MKIPFSYTTLNKAQRELRTINRSQAGKVIPCYTLTNVRYDLCYCSGILFVFYFLLLKKRTLGLGEPTLYPYTLKKLTSDSVKVLLMAVIGLRFSLTVSAKQR